MASSSRESLLTIIRDLNRRERETAPNYGKRGPATPTAWQYAGWGRETMIGGEPAIGAVGLYARGRISKQIGPGLAAPDSLHFDWNTPPNALGISESIGSFGLTLILGGAILPFAYGFSPDQYPIEAIAAPLGEWVVQTTTDEHRRMAKSKETGNMAEAVPVEPTPESLELMSGFISDPSSHGVYFRFNYAASGHADGLIIAAAATMLDATVKN